MSLYYNSGDIIIHRGHLSFDHTGLGARTKGAAYNILHAQFKNNANGATYGTNIIDYIGTDGTDTYNTCIRLGSASGTTWITAGEGGPYMPNKVAYNDENLYLSADADIRMYTSTANDASSYNYAVLVSGTSLTTPNGNLIAGTDGNTGGERQVRVQSGAGTMYLYSQAATNGERGLYVPAHGSGAAYSIVAVDTNNVSKINANYIGVRNASATTGHGISLYNGPVNGAPTYGIMFAGTATYGTHGGVTSDWATYLTMSDTTNRGWIFRRGSTNVASIDGNGQTTLNGGLEIKGHIAGDSNSTGHGLYSGGGYHNAYNNIILHGDASTGSSGIAFVSDKGTTSINQPSDRAFIQWHAHGVTTYTAEGTAPTLATSGEANILVIGVGNDAADQVRLQTPGQTGLLHQMGANAYVIPDTGNTTGTVGGVNGPVYVNGGVITACTTYANAYVKGITPAGTTAQFWRGDNSWSNTISGGLFKITNNSNTVTIGSANANWCHFENSADIPFYFNKAIHVNGDIYYYNTKVHMSSSGFHPPKNGGIYWDPYVESASDASDVSQIIQVVGGVAGGTELRIQQANDATDVINLMSPSYIYMNSKKAFTINDAWLRINEDKGFSSGVYFGTSTVRTDGEFWSDSVRIVDNWVGFYNGVQGGTRYGYIQANADGMYFVKENSTSQNEYFYFYSRIYCPSISIGYTNTSYSLSASSAIINSWIRTKGSTGWYNEDYGGGWYMSDTTYVRAYNSKRIYTANSEQYSVYTEGGFCTTRGGAVFSIYYSGAWRDIIHNHGNGNVSIDGASGSLFLSYYAGYTYFGGGTYCIDRSGYFNGTSAAANQIYVTGSSGTQYLTGVPEYSTKNQTQYIYSPCYMSGGNLYAYNLYATSGLIVTTANGITAYFGAQNNSFVHFTNNAAPYYFDHSVYVNGTLYWYSNSSYYWNGNAGYSSTYYTNNWFRSYNATGWYNESYGGGIYMSDNSYVRVYNGKYFIADRVYNAVWNDYAECRNVETEEPGRCVTETTSKKMALTTERLQAGCKFISDTFGTCIGETEQAKVPIAIAGRVLAYPYRAREEYKLGDAVCSAPNGTVDIMTRDEIMMYPERIVGTVSEIPDYEIWQAGSKENPSPIQVNGRIWIYVK